MSTARVEILSAERSVTLGRAAEFAVTGVERLSRVQYFLKHDGILYPTPLSSSETSVRFVPEAPGAYTICAHWCGESGEAGWAEASFRIDGPPSTGTPERVRLRDGGSAWTPSRWEATLAGQHEARALDALRRLIRPGATVYDIGANIGLFATRFSQWVGPTGHVYCLEPNPVCVYFLRANLQATSADNFEILPVCVTDSPRSIDFTVNYGSSVLGMAPDSAFSVKPGHQIAVEGTSFDALLGKLCLRVPNVIKIDVEGAEGAVVAGMLDTLTRHKPILMIELHGVAAAHAALARLEPLEYRYQELSGGRQFSSATELAAWMPDACVQVMGLA